MKRLAPLLRSAIDAGALLLVLLCLTGCHTPPFRVTVLSYNIRHGEGTDGKVDLRRTAAVIRSVQPDLVALQEVDNKTQRTRMVDQTAELGRLTGLHAAFGRAINYSGGQYGAAILSRWAFEQVTPNILPASPGHELRPALVVKVIPGRRLSQLWFASTHLDHESEAERIVQAKVLLDLLSPSSRQPIILAGDLNALPDSPVLQLFDQEWMNPTASQDRFTVPAEQPRRQIDYVLCHPAGAWRVVETRVLDSTASDHRPLLVILEWVGRWGAR